MKRKRKLATTKINNEFYCHILIDNESKNEFQLELGFIDSLQYTDTNLQRISNAE